MNLESLGILMVSMDSIQMFNAGRTNFDVLPFWRQRHRRDGMKMSLSEHIGPWKGQAMDI